MFKIFVFNELYKIMKKVKVCHRYFILVRFLFFLLKRFDFCSSLPSHPSNCLIFETTVHQTYLFTLTSLHFNTFLERKNTFLKQKLFIQNMISCMFCRRLKLGLKLGRLCCCCCCCWVGCNDVRVRSNDLPFVPLHPPLPFIISLPNIFIIFNFKQSISKRKGG